MNPAAKALFILAAAFFVAPPIVAGVVAGDSDNSPAMTSDDIEGMTAGLVMVGFWFVAFLLVAIGVVTQAVSSRRPPTPEAPSPCVRHRVGECPMCRPDERRAPASELGRRRGTRWICNEHGVVGCPRCAARVSAWDIPTAAESWTNLTPNSGRSPGTGARETT